jgi:hypothetical protein
MEKQLQEACSKNLDSLAIYQKEGSGWILDEILHLDLNMSKYIPLKSSSYIPLTKKLKTKKAIINIKNSDNKTSVLCGQSLLLYIQSLNMWTDNPITCNLKMN